MRLSPQPDGGLLVVDTVPGSVASHADLAAGDRVLEIDGTPVASLDDTQRLSALHRSPLKLTLQRGGRRFGITLEF